jgi:hypothetical protein
MQGVPNIYTPTQIQQHTVSSSKDGKHWVPARGEPYPGLKLLTRIKRAWMVFTGKADVLRWEG